MTYKLSQRSLNNLASIHPDLVAVVHEAIKITPIDFAVIEGLRSVEKQKNLVASGASKTMRSRHLTGHAIDLAAIIDGEIRWNWPPYEIIAVAMKKAANDLDVAITWGGDFVSFKDGVHYELSWSNYP